MGQGCSCADSNDKEQEVRTDPVSQINSSKFDFNAFLLIKPALFDFQLF